MREERTGGGRMSVTRTTLRAMSLSLSVTPTSTGSGSSHVSRSSSDHSSGWPNTPICSPASDHIRTVQSEPAVRNPEMPVRYSAAITERACARHESRTRTE